MSLGIPSKPEPSLERFIESLFPMAVRRSTIAPSMPPPIPSAEWPVIRSWGPPTPTRVAVSFFEDYKYDVPWGMFDWIDNAWVFRPYSCAGHAVFPRPWSCRIGTDAIIYPPRAAFRDWLPIAVDAWLSGNESAVAVMSAETVPGPLVHVATAVVSQVARKLRRAERRLAPDASND